MYAIPATLPEVISGIYYRQSGYQAMYRLPAINKDGLDYNKVSSFKDHYIRPYIQPQRQRRIIWATRYTENHFDHKNEVAEWLAHWLLLLDVPGSIPAGEENLLVRTRFPSCHLQE